MHPIVSFFRTELKKLADPVKSAQMKAYMKNVQDFYGVPSPQRREILKEGMTRYPITTFKDYKDVTWELWNGTYREDRYMALDLSRKLKKFRIDDAMPLFVRMLKQSDNWDLVDELSVHQIGEMFLTNRKHEALAKKWATDKNFWLRRASILVHHNHRKKTNLPLLEKTIVRMMHEKEFFIRKAIGWILRQYAKTDPKWVLRFVKTHEHELSGLSKREALKHL